MSTTLTLNTEIHLCAQQLEALKAIGRESNTFADWSGVYTTLPDLRSIGLAFPLLGYWRLTTLGREVYERAFGVVPV
jgi:hypothetical protein